MVTFSRTGYVCDLSRPQCWDKALLMVASGGAPGMKVREREREREAGSK
jgi:hypothetical protein